MGIEEKGVAEGGAGSRSYGSGEGQEKKRAKTALSGGKMIDAAGENIERAIQRNGAKIFGRLGAAATAVTASIGVKGRIGKGEKAGVAVAKEGIKSAGGIAGASEGSLVGASIGSGCGPAAAFCSPVLAAVGAVLGGSAGGDLAGAGVEIPSQIEAGASEAMRAIKRWENDVVSRASSRITPN